MSLTPSTVHSLVADLRAVLGDRVSTAAAVRDHHSHGESWHASAEPDAVVFPETTDEVRAVVRACASHGAPIIPFGIGSSLEGHVNAFHGGVSIDMTRMAKVLRLSPEDMDVTVEAGLTHRTLNERLKNTGLMFMVDPGADATIGGMTATRASGTAAVRYGTMRETVLGLTVVLADGRVITTGGRARKSSSGYDLTRLFVGSEGTLGVITDVTLRLYGRPEAISTAVCGFASMEGAATTVIETIQLGVQVARVEIIDEAQLAIVNRFSKTAFPEVPTLFFEFHGPSPAVVEEQARLVRDVADEHGCTSLHVDDLARGTRQAVGGPSQRALRHHHVASGLQSVDERRLRADCAPRGVHPETQADLAASAIVAPLVGHAGDGNFHLIFMLDPNDPAELERVAAANRPARRARAQVRRHLHRRARRGRRQARVPGARARRFARGDAHDQARARSEERHEPRQARARSVMDPQSSVESYLASLGIASHGTSTRLSPRWPRPSSTGARSMPSTPRTCFCGTRRARAISSSCWRSRGARISRRWETTSVRESSALLRQSGCSRISGSRRVRSRHSDSSTIPAMPSPSGSTGRFRDAARVAFHPNVNTATLVLAGADFQRYLAAVGHEVHWISTAV